MTGLGQQDGPPLNKSFSVFSTLPAFQKGRPTLSAGPGLQRKVTLLPGLMSGLPPGGLVCPLHPVYCPLSPVSCPSLPMFSWV